MTSRRNCQNEIAWNGISFLRPPSWEIATIGKNYLMLGTHRHPQMELTWGTGRSLLSLQKDIHKIQSRIFKHHLTATENWKPYDKWMSALSAYEVNGFCWKQSDAMCYGVIVYCPACNSVSLIQFFENDEDPAIFLENTTQVLASFKDHPETIERLWAVYDVRITLPTPFSIKSYQFYPGWIKLVFISQGRQITFNRWSPASVLLSSRKLIQFIELLDIAMDGTFLTSEQSDRFEWESLPPSTLWKRLIASVSGRNFHRRVLIRHDPVNNRILAITAESRQVMDSNMLDRIFSCYEIVTD